ncbi:MAG: hypothetical protein HYZ54_00495 [Ignavibacteriae bacterium]|nr:hypothetical protein [Ignavibacteriota bacterium]
MKNHYLLILLSALTVVLISCENRKDNESATFDSTKKAPSQMLYSDQNTADRNAPLDTIIPSVEKKYLISSGILTMKVDISGIKSTMNTIVYFDRYGNRECTETSNTQDMGNGNIIKTQNLSFNADGYIYRIDLVARTGTKAKYNPKAMTGGFSFAGLTDKIRKQYNIKKIGTSIVLGKQCDQYSMNAGDMRGEFDVWKNLTLNLTTQTGGLITRVTTTKLEENVSIPKDKFTVPSDVKITER